MSGVQLFMKKQILFLSLLLSFSTTILAQDQRPLPGITVRNINNKIIVSWINDYTKPVVTLSIQRSYDSLKNYTTIGSVLSPQSRENGYADANFPYNKMYYRVFVAFEGGSYIVTTPARPIKDTTGNVNAVTDKFPWLADPNAVTPEKPGSPAVPLASTTVFTARDNNVVIHVPEYATGKYSVKFFDESENMIFEVNNIKDEYLILEKVNFKRTGNYRFELYENGVKKETNRFQIVKEGKKL
jgi:hypothetical protein